MPDRPRRPLPVWIIFLFYTISSVYSSLSVFLITSGAVDLPPEQQAYVAKFTTFDMVIGYVVSAITVVGAFLLFRLKKAAVRTLFLAFGVNLFSSAVFYLRNDPTRVIDPSGLLYQAGGIALFGVVCFYARHLAQNDVLR